MKPPRTLADAAPVLRLGRSSRPTNAAVLVTDGNIEKAIKDLKNQRGAAGLVKLLKRDSHLFSYFKPSVRRRQKAGRARAAQRKLAAKRAERELRRDPLGLRPTRREVINRPAA